jgi:D-alanyl-D-alanine carboxypeptidase
MVLLGLLAACGGHSARHASTRYNPSRYYPPPGPSSDPWGPYIHEASGRFGVPELWVRRVMRQESGGQQDVISWAGAMGLMQVMPDTYDGLRGRYNLGDDPFDPHNNILAGTAYLREMYDRFGAPGFLAAYNAGPNRLDRYLNSGTPLPTETVNYVASLAPLLGPGTPMSGPLAVYGTTQFAARRSSSGCDPDAAYDPARPCVPISQPAVVAVAAPAPAYSTAGCDPDAAYDPTRPCRPAPAVAAAPPLAVVTSADCDPDAAFDPAHPCRPAPVAAEPVVAAPIVAQALPPLVERHLNYAGGGSRPLQESGAQRAVFNPGAGPGPTAGRWGIQVGAYANLATAQAAAESARAALPDALRTAKIELPATTPFGGKMAFRARLVGLPPAAASDACARLSGRGMACITVPPARDAG